MPIYGRLSVVLKLGRETFPSVEKDLFGERCSIGGKLQHLLGIIVFQDLFSCFRAANQPFPVIEVGENM